MAVAAAAVVLAAAGVTYALTYGPQQTPGAGDLPLVITARAVDRAPAAPVNLTPAAGAVAHAAAGGTSKPSSTTGRSSGTSSHVTAPKTSKEPPADQHSKKPHDKHEVVSPPVHESDGKEHPKDSQKH
jgi:hypothetical protein